MNHPILALSLCAIVSCLALSAHAGDLRVPAGMLLCRLMEDALSPTHAGCWYARGGQRVERINPMPTVSQLLVRSSDGSESLIVYGLRDAADEIQTQGAHHGIQ